MSGKRVETRLPPELDARFEAWRLSQEVPPPRGVALRYVVEQYLMMLKRVLGASK
jgi:hypothetical protein